MLIYVNITDRQTDRQTHQKYSWEPHNHNDKIGLVVSAQLYIGLSHITITKIRI
jgi:hypothetical protein